MTRLLPIFLLLWLVGCGEKAKELKSSLESKKELLDSSIEKVKEAVPDFDIIGYKQTLAMLMYTEL